MDNNFPVKKLVRSRSPETYSETGSAASGEYKLINTSWSVQVAFTTRRDAYPPVYFDSSTLPNTIQKSDIIWEYNTITVCVLDDGVYSEKKSKELKFGYNKMYWLLEIRTISRIQLQTLQYFAQTFVNIRIAVVRHDLQV